MLSMLVRLSVPGMAADGSPLPDPSYGGQLQNRAILGVEPEGRPVVSYEEVPGTYGDGDAYSLRRPLYAFEELAYGAMDPDLRMSPRVAPAVFGLGLLEAIPEADILGLADPDDEDGDGISGRPNYPADPVTGEPGLGRFGWKANQVDLRAQNTGAFLGDVGITTSVHPDQNCQPSETDCRAAPGGGDPEAGDDIIEFVNFYTRTLAVPARRDVGDPTVLAGRELFHDIGCVDCHVANFTTGPGRPELPQVADQLIWPYTDLLLHDMG
jgi:CxxC motif-containing protein (DUF1111 family)